MIKSYNKGRKKFYEVRVSTRNKGGKQICRRRSGISSITKANQIDFELKCEVKKLAGEETPYTWEEWHDEILKRMKLEYKTATLMNYGQALKKWLPDEWSKKLVKDFTKSHVHKLIFEDMEDATASIRKNTLKRIHRVFSLALEEGLILKNPASSLKVKVPKSDMLVLNSIEAQKLLQEALKIKHDYFEVWTLALLTGLRSGELYALRWEDIDFQTGFITVKRQWTVKDGLHPTKNNRNRPIPISEDLGLFLKKWKVKTQGGFSEILWNGVYKKNVTFDDYVLPRLHTWRSSEQAKILKKFCLSLGITPVRFHDLRATFITNMLAQGVSLPKVMQIVGHSRMDTTDGYLRNSGVNLVGSTSKLGYSPPTGESAKILSII